MPGIEGFLKELPEAQWDVVVQVMNDLRDSTSPDRVESLRQFLQTLNREIDAINRKRDAIGQKVDNIDALLPVIDGCRKPDDLELNLFRNLLLGWRASLKAEIIESRPEGKLEKKYDTERKRDLLQQLAGLVQQLSGVMADARKPKVQSLCTPPTEGEIPKAHIAAAERHDDKLARK
jgi:hypothetical protein